MGTDLERRPAYPLVPVPARRASEAAIPRAVRSARRNPHVSVPALVPVGCWTCALVMHSVPDGALVTVAVAATGAVATWVHAPHRWKRNKKWWRDQVLYARASAVAAAGWLSLAAWLGPASADRAPLTGLLVIGCAAWGYPWWNHRRPRGRRQRRQLMSEWGMFWQVHATDFGVPGSHLLEAGRDGVTVTLTVQLRRGKQTVSRLRASVDLIESALDGQADAGMVSVDQVKGNPSRALVRIRGANPLAERVEWPEHLAPRSVHDPYAPVMSEDGEYRLLTQLTSSGIGGMTGSGKSTFELGRIAALSGCSDAIVVVIDLKGGRSARPVLEAEAAEWVITTVSEARMWLRLCQAEILARSEGHYKGHADLHAIPECPAVFTVIDETSELTGSRGDRECRDLVSFIASKGRGLAFFVDVASQYWALDASVGTEETRINLPLRVSFRTETAAQGKYILDDPRADSSALENPGDLLLKLGPKADTLRLRGVDMSHDLFREVAGRNAGRVRRPPWILYSGGDVIIAADEARGIPAVTRQDWWDGRWARLRPAFRDGSPAYQRWADEQPEPVQPRQPAPAPSQAPPAPQPAGAMLDDESPSEVAARIDADTAPPAQPPSAPLPRLTRERVREMRAEQTAVFCAALQAAAAGITAGELIAACGRSSSWVYETLKRLTTAGAIVKDGDRWHPQPGTSIAAALAEVDAADERVKADAKAMEQRSMMHIA